MKANTLDLEKTNRRKEEPKRRHKSQRPTHSHTQVSHENTKLEVIIYAEDLIQREALCLLPWFLEVHISFAHIHLEGIVSLVSSIPSGPCTLPASSVVFPMPWGEVSDGDTSFRALSRSLTLCIMPGCGSLHSFPSASGRSFSDDGWARNWSMSITKCY